MLKTSDFYYDLPEELIAQTPLEPRDSSRLLVYNRTTGEVFHRHFRDVGDYLNPGDLLVVNTTKVYPRIPSMAAKLKFCSLKGRISPTGNVL